MEMLLSPGSVWLFAVIAAVWTALLCLKALGSELEYQRKRHDLMTEARQLHDALEARRERLHKLNLSRPQERSPAAPRKEAATEPQAPPDSPAESNTPLAQAA